MIGRYADLGGFYPPPAFGSGGIYNILFYLHNSAYHTQPHPKIAKYTSLPLYHYAYCYRNNLGSDRSKAIAYTLNELI